jgi:prepilin-type processing-associated H-X9-DG protein
MSDKKQLGLAWTMYSSDNNDRLAINSDPHVNNSSSYPASSMNPCWITGSLDWGTGTYNVNTDYMVNERYSLLGNYLGKAVKVFACPAANFASPVQRQMGWNQRVRSIAMNGAVGEGDKYLQPANPFGWTQWYVAKKASDFHTPGPSDCWVFSDEHPDSVDDALMYTSSYATTSFTELPGNQHGGACGLAFADGHGEIHKWTGPVMNQHQSVTYTSVQRVSCSLTDPDMLWLAQRTPQN